MTENPESNPNPTPPSEKPSEMAKGPFDWRVVLIAVYLFILLLVSVNWLAGLMMANTSGLDDQGNKITACRDDLGSPCVVKEPGNANRPPANTSNTTTVPANTTNTNQVVNTNAVNANRPANSNAADPKATVTPANGKSNSNTNANPGTSPPSPEIADVIVIKNFGLFGWPAFSTCRFCDEGCLSGDGFLFLIVLFGGMLGAIIRSLTYLGWHVGKGSFSINYTWYYLFQPFFGATLAVIFYVVIRGGFGSGAIGKNNLFSFAAVAFLAGLFTENVMAKLKLIAESLLVSTQKPTNPPKKDGDGGGGNDRMGTATRGPAGAAATGDSSVTGTAPRNIGRDEPPV